MASLGGGKPPPVRTRTRTRTKAIEIVVHHGSTSRKYGRALGEIWNELHFHRQQNQAQEQDEKRGPERPEGKPLSHFLHAGTR